MKVSIATFIALVLASSSLATPAVKRKGPGKRGLAWPWYNTPLNPGKLNDGQGTVNLMCVLESLLFPYFKLCCAVTIGRPTLLPLPTA
jgi:hypothetical protein